MIEKERIIKAIEAELNEAEIDVKEFGDDKSLYAFNQGRILAHNYDLIVINRILSEKEKRESEC